VRADPSSVRGSPLLGTPLEPSATHADLRLVGWSFLLIELVVGGLTVIAGWFGGRKAALVVGLGFTALVVVALALVLGFCFAIAWVSQRPSRRGPPFRN
jgi:hypothetical protein